MNNLKYLDRYQLIIIIVGIASFAASMVAFIVMLITATVVYNESGAIDSLAYNDIAVTIYGVFMLTHLTALTWFLARTLTYKLRIKEEDVL